MRIRELDSEMNEPARILGIVVDNVSGIALVQDIYDDVKDAEKIWVSFEDELEMEKKYILIGDVTQDTVDDEKRLVLNATIAFGIDELDIDLYREAVEMERSVIDAMKS
ncbi:hypothetical protein EU546_03320 [Candidatus Thorarchaeota archaeon]|nr:MAG: hypothetical protein EU546_03320 [Candidatus Thorarchaeota archaeon]